MDIHSVVHRLGYELEEQRQQNQALYAEKVSALASAKEKAMEDQKFEVERARQTAREEGEGALSNMRRELQAKEELVSRLQSQLDGATGDGRETEALLEKMEKTLLGEINEECRKTALVLGVSPRKASASGVKLYGNRGHKRTLSRSLTASAIANMRACNDELRSHVVELQRELEGLKLQVHKLQKSKDIELENLRIEMQKEKVRDMDELKERLIQISVKTSPHSSAPPTGQSDPVANAGYTNGESYPEHTEHRSSSERRPHSKRTPTEPQSSSYEDDTLNHAARRHQSTDEPLHHSHDAPGSTSAMLKSLQSRVRAIQKDHSPPKEDRKQQRRSQPPPSAANRSHRLSSFSSSTPDLTLRNARQAADQSYTQSMEQKLRLAELRAQLAEERANRNQDLLGQKIKEMSHLQTSMDKSNSYDSNSKDQRRGYSPSVGNRTY